MMAFLSSLFFWLGERLRDAAMWPINLVRDFPARGGRVARTLLIGVGGVAAFGPHLLAARRAGEIRPFLRQTVGRISFWLHRMGNELFDLAGGPELGEFFLHLITNTTPLTGTEIGQAAAVLGPTGMRYGDVRVAQGGLLDLIFKLNGNLAFATWHTISLPKSGRHTRDNWPLVMHELTHVYQYEHIGSRYLGEAIYMLVKTKRDCYDYGDVDGLKTAVVAGKRYLDYNREQQAMIVQDFCFLTARGADVQAYAPFIAQLRAGKL